MAKIEGLKAVLDMFRRRGKVAVLEEKVSVVVGFQTTYALKVHEDLVAYHPVGQAKYLEQPARELKPEFQRIIKEAKAKGMTLAQALMLTGLRLQREAQTLTPVDTGLLRSSAFTKEEQV